MSIAAVLLVACGSGAPSDGGTDGADVSVPEPELIVGSGETELSPLTDGETVELVRGHQGLQHIVIALRFTGMDPDSTTVELALRRVRDGQLVSDRYRVRLPFEAREDGWFERPGILLVVPEPTDALGEELHLTARIENRADQTAETEAKLRIAWAEP